MHAVGKALRKALPCTPPLAPQDACTYLVAAGCAFALPRALGAPDAATRHLKKAASRRGSETGGTAGEAAAEAVRRRPKDTDEGEAEGDAALEAGGGGSLGPGVSHPERRHHHHQALQPLSREPAGTPAEVPALQEHEQAPPRGGSRAGAAAAAALPARDVHHASGSSSRPGRGSTAALLVAARAAIAEGWAATAEGWSYMAAPANREVSAIVAMKCAAALVWGAIDVSAQPGQEGRAPCRAVQGSTMRERASRCVGIALLATFFSPHVPVPSRPAPPPLPACRSSTSSLQTCPRCSWATPPPPWASSLQQVPSMPGREAAGATLARLG